MSSAETFVDKLRGVEKRYQELEDSLIRPELRNNQAEYKKLAKERSSIEEVVACFREWQKVTQELEDSKALLEDQDPEVRTLAQEEQTTLREQYERLENQLRRLLIPKDPLDEKNVLLEIRAGTGGEEAS